jgi:hypothetical protein
VSSLVLSSSRPLVLPAAQPIARRVIPQCMRVSDRHIVNDWASQVIALQYAFLAKMPNGDVQ